jgi:transcription factor TFIIIB component B''
MISKDVLAVFIVNVSNLKNKYFRAVEEQQEEEQVDEPTAERGNKQNDETAADEDIAMPVPQVKVGPDGQIILDEKSLVG